MRLGDSRMSFVRAYRRETQEMVFDAHDRAFAFYKGACTRGIYDNMKTAVDAIFLGKERAYNVGSSRCAATISLNRLRALQPRVGKRAGRERSRHDPRAAVLASGAGQELEELNDWLADQCVARAKTQPHAEMSDRTVWEVFEAERASLVPIGADLTASMRAGFVSKTCLVRYDTNKYSYRPAPLAARWKCAPTLTHRTAPGRAYRR